MKISLRTKLRDLIKEAVETLFGDASADAATNAATRQIIDRTEPVLEFPSDFEHGDYSTNIAMVLAKQLTKNPRELATSIVVQMNKQLAEEKKYLGICRGT